MKATPVCLVGGGLAGMIVLTAVAAESLARWWDASMRAQVYAGGLAGIVIGLVGLAFAVKLARLREAGDGFWKWWGGGMLARLALMACLAAVLALSFPANPAAALLSMGVVYLIGMFSEAAWVAKRLADAPRAAQKTGGI